LTLIDTGFPQAATKLATAASRTALVLVEPKTVNPVRT
jgi:hypothetical protein